MRLIERRTGLLFAGFLLCFSLILVRAFWLQGVQGATLADRAVNQQTEVVTVPGLRGRVLDRHGAELAISENAATIFATPYQVVDPRRTAYKLAKILKLKFDDVLAAISDDGGFSYIAHKVDLKAAREIANLELPGIGELPDSRRTYPQGKLASQLIGAVGSENQGLTGLEGGEDDTLSGSDGKQLILKDALGEALRLTTLEPSSDGHDIELTIDSAIQARTEQVLDEVGRTYHPDGATAIVMNPQTSEILAMANWPPVATDDLGEVAPEDLLNRATGFNYEPGSTFKAFTVAGALQDGLVTPRTPFTLASTIQVGDRVINESHSRGTETLTVSEILAQSSNIGAITIGLKLGAERFDEWVREFGFGEPTGIRFPGEERGIVLDPADYYSSSMGNMPIGQGISVTPIQIAAAYAAIANGGILRPPKLISKIDGEEVDSGEEKQILRPLVAGQVRRMLEGVLAPGGTAEEVSVPGYTLAGKTGTAQKAIPGGYSATDYIASFIGFAPARDPQLLVAVMVDVPKGSYYGGTVAAPAFGEIASFALPYLGIAPQ